MNYLAIITARCGSKGTHGKFLQDLVGRPMLAWSIEHALTCPAVTRTVVATDSDELAIMARLAGAEVPSLIPAALTKENASPEPILLYILDELAKKDGFKPDAVILLNPATPLRLPGRMTAAIWQFEAEMVDSLVSVCSTPAFFWKNPKKPQASHDISFRSRPQEIPESERMYRENGSITITRTTILQATKSLLGEKVSLFMMDERESQCIDSPALAKMAQEWSGEKGSVDLSTRRNPLEWMDAVVFDFDGVLTDNRVLVSQDGTEAVYCSRSDGMGFDILRKASIPAFIMSTETNPVVSARAAKLKLPVFQGIKDKGESLKALCLEKNYSLERIVFVGNDINDLPAMQLAGYPIAVADAMPVVRKAAWRVLKSPGGAGIVRELLETVLGITET
ncbi:MAG: acylneuraminate cytidylyltransferase [Magnetococcales bacterium]|nr:acylneuraminate cytidylyltransferase [Magnetococcales bacterium]MBF0439999.1 acylneuraminate cytidylyltransferase [Magnetococcales bacterium]